MRMTLAVLVAVALLAVAAVLGAGELLSQPARHAVGAPPNVLSAESVVIDLSPAESVSGWFARGTPGHGAVLLLHGVRSDRRQMIERAKFLQAAGRAVLLLDLPAHGESSGKRITFGFREAAGVEAAMRFIRQTLPGEPTAVIGVSLGAASLVLADLNPAADAVVLESMYPTITEAVADRLRLRLGAFGGGLAPLLLWQLPLRIGVSVDQLRPIDHLSALHAPVLIIGGTDDRHTTVAETRRLYDAALEPKALWLVDGAAHVDLHAFDPAAYEARVSRFLQDYMRHPDPAVQSPVDGTRGSFVFDLTPP